MIINHNMSAINANRQMATNQANTAKSTEKLSSGLRINRAGDDAAGLAISEKMRAQISGLNQASSNAQDGISLIQTAEGALNETHSILQRMRELSVQGSNDTTTNDDRAELQKEMNQLIEEVDRIASDTEFNTQKVLDGTYADKKLHIGANENQVMNITIGKIDSTTLGTNGENKVSNLLVGYDFTTTKDATVKIGNTEITLDKDYTGAGSELAQDLTNAFQTSEGITVTFNETSKELVFTSSGKDAVDITFAGTDASNFTGGASTIATAPGTTTGEAITSLHTERGAGANIGITTQAGAEKAITSVDNAIKSVSAERSKLGAYQNRLEHTINNLGTSSENLTSAESRIRDVDMAEEMMEFTKNNVLSQASQAMLAQAKALPNQVLSLLQ